MSKETAYQERTTRYELVHLRAWRLCAHLTLEALARRANLALQTVHRAENGKRKPYMPVVRALAAALDIPAEILLTYSPLDDDDEARAYAEHVAYRGMRERLAQFENEPTPVGV